MTVTKKLATFIVKTNLADMPPEVVTMTKRAMIDTIGVALAGSVHPAGKPIAAFVDKFAGIPASTVIGNRIRTCSPLAAMANGTLAHLLDYDDCKVGGTRGHASAVLIPTVLALGEELMASGKEVIQAYVLGIEAWSRMAGVVPEHLLLNGFHPTSILGTVGAAAAAAKLLRLTAEQTAIALGIAGSEAAGLIRNFGTMTKPLHAGNAAKNGIMAALLAKEGFTASQNILEGETNFLQTFYGNGIGDVSKIAENLGSPYALISPALHVKQYPSCASTHRAVDAILYLAKQHYIKPEEVESITCLSTPTAKTNLIYSSPRTALEGKFSMPFTVAAALTDRKFGLAQVTNEKVNEPAVRDLMKRVTFSVHPDWVIGKDTRSTRPDVVKVKLKNGKEYSHEVLTAKGMPQNPLSEVEILGKYRECASLALRDEAVEKCVELVWQLERLENLKELMRTLSGKVSSKK